MFQFQILSTYVLLSQVKLKDHHDEKHFDRRGNKNKNKFMEEVYLLRVIGTDICKNGRSRHRLI